MRDTTTGICIIALIDPPTRSRAITRRYIERDPALFTYYTLSKQRTEEKLLCNIIRSIESAVEMRGQHRCCWSETSSLSPSAAALQLFIACRCRVIRSSGSKQRAWQSTWSISPSRLLVRGAPIPHVNRVGLFAFTAHEVSCFFFFFRFCDALEQCRWGDGRRAPVMKRETAPLCPLVNAVARSSDCNLWLVKIDETGYPFIDSLGATRLLLLNKGRKEPASGSKKKGEKDITCRRESVDRVGLFHCERTCD